MSEPNVQENHETSEQTNEVIRQAIQGLNGFPKPGESLVNPLLCPPSPSILVGEIIMSEPNVQENHETSDQTNEVIRQAIQDLNGFPKPGESLFNPLLCPPSPPSILDPLPIPLPPLYHHPHVPNSLCPFKTEEEEQAAREEAVASQIPVYRSMLPQLLKDFAEIEDPRNPKKVKHKLTVLLIYGLLTCVFQMESRREANKKMSRPRFLKNLQELFPELESLPHADTLARLLERIDVLEIESAHVELIRKFIRNKKFRRFLIRKSYPIAIDGTQKLARNGTGWGEEWLERKIKTKDGEEIQQYVYVLEANIVLHNGLTIPLLSEFLCYSELDPDDKKQDCELKAFKRLAARLKSYFPHLPIIVLLDGLYPNGPLMEQCDNYGWKFMIVLPDKSLPSVWKAVEIFRQSQFKNQGDQNWRGRRQHFWWVNDITYVYDDGKKNMTLHVVVCEETWEEIDKKTDEKIEKKSRHVWISNLKFNKENIHELCNLGARFRWGIEVSMQTEKRRGYNYEHLYSHNWKAMKGFHFLMRLGHMMNAIALYTKRVAKQVRRMGIKIFLEFFRETCANPWLSQNWIKNLLNKPFQIRLE